MKIMVRAPLMADKIKDLLDGQTLDGARFSFVSKSGMDMTFEVTGDDLASLDPAAIAKSAIKSTSFGKGIYFSVTDV